MSVTTTQLTFSRSVPDLLFVNTLLPYTIHIYVSSLLATSQVPQKHHVCCWLSHLGSSRSFPTKIKTKSQTPISCCTFLMPVTFTVATVLWAVVLEAETNQGALLTAGSGSKCSELTLQTCPEVPATASGEQGGWMAPGCTGGSGGAGQRQIQKGP